MNFYPFGSHFFSLTPSLSYTHTHTHTHAHAHTHIHTHTHTKTHTHPHTHTHTHTHTHRADLSCTVQTPSYINDDQLLDHQCIIMISTLDFQSILGGMMGIPCSLYTLQPPNILSLRNAPQGNMS